MGLWLWLTSPDAGVANLLGFSLSLVVYHIWVDWVNHISFSSFPLIIIIFCHLSWIVDFYFFFIQPSLFSHNWWDISRFCVFIDSPTSTVWQWQKLNLPHSAFLWHLQSPFTSPLALQSPSGQTYKILHTTFCQIWVWILCWLTTVIKFHCSATLTWATVLNWIMDNIL